LTQLTEEFGAVQDIQIDDCGARIVPAGMPSLQVQLRQCQFTRYAAFKTELTADRKRSWLP
jgi:hypothetical protein